MRHTSYGLNVIDDGRTTKKADDRRKWRLEPGKPFFAFKRFQQRRLFAANISACAAVNHQIQLEITSKNILAQIIFRISLVHGRLQAPVRLDILTTNINIRFVRTDRKSTDEGPLDQLMRI